MIVEDVDASSVAAELPRERASGRGRVQIQLNSWQTEECLNPIRGIRDWQQRNGIKPHDHHRDNVAAIRNQSRANGIEKQLERARLADAQPPFTPKLVRRRSVAPLPRRAEGAGSSAKDYVYSNALATKVASVTARQRRHEAADGDGGRWLARPDYGQVPSYLRERKLLLAERHEAAQKKRLEQLVPPGMRLMPEEERLDMLQLLAKAKAEAEAGVQALPFKIETVGQRQKAAAATKRLEEVDEAIALFSRPAVLVEA